MNLITLSGLDGSGKSTQIKLLQKHLESQGKRIYYFHAVSFSLANKIANKGKTVIAGKMKPVTQASSCAIFLRKLFLLIDLLRFNLLCKKLSKTHDYILSDRYFYDQIVNILFLSEKKPPLGNHWWVSFAHQLLKKPNLSLYLQVTPALIFQRQRTIDQGYAYLETKKMLYDDYLPRVGATIVDGNLSVEEVAKKLISLLH